MEEQGRLRVTLELDRRTDDPISGRIGLGDEVREFSGWLRLVAVLEDVRQAPLSGARSPPGGDVTKRNHRPGFEPSRGLVPPHEHNRSEGDKQ